MTPAPTNLTLLSNGADPSTRVPPPPFRWRTRVLLPGAVLVAAAGLLGAAAWHTWAPAANVDGTPVVLAATTPAEQQQESVAPSAPKGPSATVQAAGWVEPRPYPVYATALTEGVIEEILVLEGDHVSKGQPVAKLVSADASIGLDRARGELQRADAMLAEARATLDSLVMPEQAVRMAEARRAAANAALAGFASDETAAKAALVEAEEELRRKEPLVASGAVSELDFVRLRSKADAARAAVAALPARRDMLTAARDEAEAGLAAATRSRELLIGERAAVAKAEGERALAESAVREAELRLARTTVVAPIEGVVLARLVAPGMMVSTSPASAEGGRVLSLYDPHELQVRADVPNADIALVGVGQAVEIKVEALPNATLRGEVLRITAQADIAKNTVQVKVRVIDPPPELRPEMLCRVRILAGGAASGESSDGRSARQRVFAPKVLLGEGYAMVASTLRDGVGQARRRPVTVGSETRGEWVEVLDGLGAGDVLLDPGRVRDAERVRVTVRRVAAGGAE